MSDEKTRGQLGARLTKVQSIMNMLSTDIDLLDGGRKSQGVICRKLIAKVIALMKELKKDSIEYQKSLPVKKRMPKVERVSDMVDDMDSASDSSDVKKPRGRRPKKKAEDKPVSKKRKSTKKVSIEE